MRDCSSGQYLVVDLAASEWWLKAAWKWVLFVLFRYWIKNFQREDKPNAKSSSPNPYKHKSKVSSICVVDKITRFRYFTARFIEIAVIRLSLQIPLYEAKQLLWRLIYVTLLAIFREKHLFQSIIVDPNQRYPTFQSEAQPSRSCSPRNSTVAHHLCLNHGRFYVIVFFRN